MEEAVNGVRRSAYTPLQLAYLGDAYYELLARAYLLGNGDCRLSALNDAVRTLVTAERQSELLEALLPHLTEEEADVCRGGRNAKSGHRAKSASAIDYRRATGLESLFGYLWLHGRQERAEALFRLCAEYGQATERNGSTDD